MQSLQVLKIGGCNNLENVFLDNCSQLTTVDIADGKKFKNLYWVSCCCNVVIVIVIAVVVVIVYVVLIFSCHFC